MVNSWVCVGCIIAVKVVKNWNEQCFVFYVPVYSTCWNLLESCIYGVIGKVLQLASFLPLVCLWCGKHFVQRNITFNFYAENLEFLSTILIVGCCRDCNFIILTCSTPQVTLHLLKRWKVLFTFMTTSLGRTYLANVSTRCSSQNISSRNVGKISSYQVNLSLLSKN